MPINLSSATGCSSSSSLSSTSPASSTSFAEKAARFLSSLTEPTRDRPTNNTANQQHINNNEPRLVINHKLHCFEPIFLLEPTFCSHCTKFIIGIKGHKCELCKFTCHYSCLYSIQSHCVKGQLKQLNVNNDTNVEGAFKQPGISSFTIEPTSEFAAQSSTSISVVEHQFEPDYFVLPTFCDHCGVFIKNFFKYQGLKCRRRNCGITVHIECQRLLRKRCASQQQQQQQQQAVEPVKLEHFDLLGLLGQGSTSRVYLARYKTTQKDYAIKVIKKSNRQFIEDRDSAMAEKRALNLGRNFPFLTKVHACFQTDTKLFFVMEYVAGCDLYEHRMKQRKFPVDRARFYAAEITLALNYLHKQGIVYRDLKLENVIIDLEGHCKLIDFGLTKELFDRQDMRTRTYCGTPAYMSPEMLQEQDYGFSVDWWAFGVLLFEMLIGYLPFEPDLDYQPSKSIVREEIDFSTYESYLDYHTIDILRGLLMKDPKLRLGSRSAAGGGCRGEQEIFGHPFFACYQWDEILNKLVKPPHLDVGSQVEVTDLPSSLDEDPMGEEVIGFSYNSGSLNNV